MDVDCHQIAKINIARFEVRFARSVKTEGHNSGTFMLVIHIYL
jgi:hypothetical protein